MKKNAFLSSGEFAKLCNATKETLFHYDRENLLKPKRVSENGYRYYGVEQFFDFDMIAMLKDAGSSLKEIRESIHNTDNRDFLPLLEEKLRVVREERARLARRETTLRAMVEGAREALNFQYDTFMVLEQQEEGLEVFATTGAGVEDTMADFVERFAEYSAFYEKQGRTPLPPFGIILEQDESGGGQYQERYYFSRAVRSTPRALLRVKPQGLYAVMAHIGTMQSHLQAFDGFLRHMRSAGLAVDGDCYCYDMMSYILLGSNNVYAAKYCIMAKPAGESGAV